MNGANSPIVRWSSPPPKRLPGTRIVCNGPAPTCSFCGGAHSPCPNRPIEMDLPRRLAGSGATTDPAPSQSATAMLSYLVQNHTLDPSSLFAHVEYASVAHALLRTEALSSCACPSCLHDNRGNPKLGLDRGGSNAQERPMCPPDRPCNDLSLHANGSRPRNQCRDQLLTASPPPPSPQAVKGFTAYVTCGSHSDCIAVGLPESFCDDKRHCASCTKWDPSDPSASIDGRRAAACDGQHRSVGGLHSEHPHWPIAPQPRPMTLCAACRADTSQASAAGTCPSIAHVSQGRALRLADVDCTERYAQLVQCAGRTWLFSRIEHFDDKESALEPQPHTQLIARELLPSATTPGTRDALPPPAFAPMLLALDDDRPLKLSSNAAVTCTDDGDLLLYGGGEGGSGVAWLVGQPPSPGGSRTAAGGDGFQWSRPMVAWSGNKSQTRCVEARPHLPESCEYDGKLSVLRHQGHVLAFTRSNLYAHGGRHVQVSSSLSGREGWSPFEQLSFEEYAAAPANNLYYAAVRSVPTGRSLCDNVLLGLFPGAINGRGGVYVSVSADGVHWGALRRIFRSEIHASWRTSDHPVEGALDSPAATQLRIVLEHHVSVPRRRRAASDPSEQPTDERAQAWCDAKLPPLYCEYILPWAVTQHNTSHVAVRLGGLAPWLISCPAQTHRPPRNSTNSECEGSKHADERGEPEPASSTTGAAVPRAAEFKRPKVAVLVSSGPMDMQRATLARKLTSSADFLLRPLRTVAKVSTFVCLDLAQPSWQTELMRDLLAPDRTWHFTACSWQALSDVERRCCENERQPAACDAPELSTGEGSASLHQFYRLAACFQHVLHSADGAAADFYVRARPDLHWVGAFDTSALHGPGAPHRLGIRYRSAAGLHGLRLGQLQMAWYKVGPGACGEAHWQTDYPCFTLDDQFALVPARLAWRYFDFARRRLSDDFLTLRRQRAPLIANCSCWQCVEGRLTEYLLVHQVPLDILSLPATVVYDDHEAPPMLLPEHSGAGGGPHPTWSPSVRVDCALRNGTWGVAAWLVDAGLLSAATKAELKVEISTSYSMKALWQDAQAWQSLMELLWQKGGGPSTVRADFERTSRAALGRYAQRFLRHQRCNEPSAAAHAGCHEGDGEAALVSSSRPAVSLPQHRQYRSRSARSPSKRTMATHAGMAPPIITFIVQYYRHPHQLGLICERLRNPRIEVIVHADSDSDADEAAFSSATKMCGARILRSRNVHEIRGYNLAARHARGELLAFSQDDRIPPPGGEWVRRVLTIYSLGAFARLGALGLHRGGVQLWLQPTEVAPRPKLVGSCGDAADDVSGHKWDALFSERMSTPIRFVSFMNIGPIVMRRRAFEELGGFNMSYSQPGQVGIGFDHELVGRLWQVGWQAAVVCPSRATVFRNGCGGKGSAANLSARNAQMVRNRALYHQQFARHAERIEDLVAQAQRSLQDDVALLAQLRRTVRGCIDCEAGGEELRALKHRALGFEDASSCRTADPRKIAYEP